MSESDNVFQNIEENDKLSNKYGTATPDSEDSVNKSILDDSKSLESIENSRNSENSNSSLPNLPTETRKENSNSLLPLATETRKENSNSLLPLATENSNSDNFSSLPSITTESLKNQPYKNIEEITETTTKTSEIKNMTKKARSTKQREADSGQKQMLELLRDIYDKEFADIPAKFRPKPKVYVARAAWYKEEGPERDKYIDSWIKADRKATQIRMGERKRTPPVNLSENNSVDTLPSIRANSIPVENVGKFKTSIANLKERTKEAFEKMHENVDKAQSKLLGKIKQPQVRGTAKYLFKETRKLVRNLGRGFNAQTRNFEKVAKKMTFKNKNSEPMNNYS